jgi:hypothetical protein
MHSYNGDRDMTTNMVGTELVLNKMKWSGSDAWLDAPRGLWQVNDYPAGWSKEYKNLAFVTVYNSGHMVPYNQPVPARDLVTRFLRKASFMDIDLPSIRVNSAAAIKAAAATPEKKHASDHKELASLEAAATVDDTAWSSSRTVLHMGANWETASLTATAMLAGFCLALMVVKRTTRRSTRGNSSGTYQPVPDVAT